MKLLLIAGFLAILFFSTTNAQTNQTPRDQATVYLQIHKVGPAGGTIKGVYNGTPVEGTFSGGSGEGTFTLMASGMILASGTYSCNASGCTFTGR